MATILPIRPHKCDVPAPDVAGFFGGLVGDDIADPDSATGVGLLDPGTTVGTDEACVTCPGKGMVDALPTAVEVAPGGAILALEKVRD